MKAIRTHYDNLKVSRDAPDVVIRAAYKTLSQRLHPDKNPGDERAARVMAIINEAYEVLSDPVKRQEHDLWIERMEISAGQANTTSPAPQWHAPNQARTRSSGARTTEMRNPSFAAGMLTVIKEMLFRVLTAVFGLAVAFGALWLVVVGIDAVTDASPPPPSPRPYSQVAQPAAVEAPRYLRPIAAPNGSPWPATAAYVESYPRLRANGLSEVTVDNSQNDSDVFVKLVSLNEAIASPVRHMFIPAGSRFTMKNVAAGQYDVRYRDLNSGALSRSESFGVEERRTVDGTEYSSMTLTLYKVQGGNFQTFDLSESEF